MDARSNVAILRQTVDSMSCTDRTLARALSGVSEDLGRILALLDRDAGVFRLDRGFFLVRSRNLRDALLLYPPLRDGGDEAACTKFLQDLASAFRAVKAARDTLESSFRSETLLAVSVLADEVNRDEASPSSPTRSWRDAVVNAVPEVRITSVTGFAGRKARALSSILGSGWDQLGVAFARSVSDPVMMRLVAAQGAAESAVMNGAGAGLLLGILCPPLLPLTGGVAALAAIEAWNEKMKALRTAAGTEREAQTAEIRERRRKAIMELTGGSTTAATETEHVRLLVDGETGVADITLLSGAHAGTRWADLNTQQQASETRRLTQLDGDSLRLLQAVRGAS